MTIDEAIEKEKANAEKLRKIIETGYDGEISIEALFCDDTDAIKEVYERFENCAKEHEQLAEWLEELKVYHQHEVICNKGYNAGYNKAIDDCKELTFREVAYYDSLNDRTEFRELAEQLKAGGDNE